MLSTNSSVSVPVVSRKYSAMVRARQGNTQTRTWWFVHLTEHHACLFDNCYGPCHQSWLPAFPATGRFLHEFVHQPLRTPNNHRGHYAIRAISSVRITVLPRPAPPNSPALPPRTNGVSKIDNLNTRFKQLGTGRQVVHSGSCDGE